MGSDLIDIDFRKTPECCGLISPRNKRGLERITGT